MAAKKEAKSDKKSATAKKIDAQTEKKTRRRTAKTAAEEAVSSTEESAPVQEEIQPAAGVVNEETVAGEETAVAGEETAVVEDPAVREETSVVSEETVAGEETSAISKGDDVSGEEEKAAGTQPDTEAHDVDRFDVIITSERPGYRPPKAAVYSMVQQLAFRCYASPVDEAIAETWTEIYFEPGVAAHEIFLKTGYESDIPVFKEICMRFSEKPFFCDYAENPKRPLYWAIEIRGSRFTTPIGPFRKIFLDALNLRIESASRKFTSLPEHAVVPDDELPVEKKKRERTNGLAGTEVEEM